MGEDLASLVVEFTANIEQVTSAGSEVGAVFERVAASAAESANAITESMTGATEGFAALTEAGSTAGDELVMALGASASDVASAVSDGMSSASESTAALSDAAASAGATLSSSLSEAASSASAAISDDMTNASESIGQVGTSASEAGSSLGESFSHFSVGGMLNQAGMAIFSLQNIANVSEQAANSLLGPAMSAEQVQQSFSNLLGSSKAAADELNQLNTFAAKTQFKTQDIDLAASTMIGFGYSAKSVVPNLTAIGDALTAVGRGTPAEMQSVVNIFGKIQTQGKLTQGDLTQLGAHGINALSLIALGAGKTTAQIQAMIKGGTLPANQAIADLTQGIEKNPIYSGGMAKQAGTLTGLLSTLKSNFAQVLAAFGSPILTAVEPLVNNLANSFSSPGFKTFAGGIGKGIVDIFTQLGGVLHGINIGGLTAQFSAFTSKLNFKPVIDLLGTAFKTVAQILGSINFGEVGATLSTLAGVISNILGHAFTVLGPILAQVFKWFSNDLLPVLNQALPPIGDLVNAVLDLAGTALKPLLTALEPLLPPVLQLAGGIATVLTPVLQILAPILSAVLVPAIQLLIAPLQALLDLLTGNWSGALSAIGLGFLSVGDKAKQMQIQTEEAHTKMALVADQKTGEAATKAIANAEKERVGILQKLKETHDPAEKAELEHQLKMIDTQIQAQQERLKKADEDKQQQLAKQKELHDAMLEAQKTGLQKLLDSWGQGLGNMFSGLGTFTHNVIGNVGTFFSQLGTKVHDGIAQVGKFFSDFGKGLHIIWNDVVSTIKSGINTIIGDINGFIGGIDSIHVSVPNVGTIGFNIPKIPLLEAGGTVAPGAAAIVGETGKPELILGGMSGATVVGVSQTAALMAAGSQMALSGGGGGIGGSGNGQVTVTVPLNINGREFARATVDDFGAALMGQIRSSANPRGGLA